MTALESEGPGRNVAETGGLDTALDRAEIGRILGEIRDRGARAARHAAAEHGFRRVYMGGAPLAGLGSPCSDIDIFVVLDGEDRSTEQFAFEGQRVDVEYVQLAELETLVRRFTTFEGTSTDTGQLSFAGRSRLDRTARFLLSEIVVDEGGQLAALHAQLAKGEDAFRKVLIARHAQDIQNAGEDVIGALLNGDPSNAEYQSREMVYRGAEAYLAGEGDVYVNTKWVWAKWDRTVGDKAGGQLAEVLHDLGMPSTRDAVIRNLWLTQDLVAMAATGYRYVPVLDVTPPFCRRNPRHTLLPFADGFFATHEVGSATELSREGVLLWMLAHGRTKADAVAAARASFAAEGVEIAQEDVSAYYDILEQSGLMAAVPESDDRP
ncbi:hypothetical protein OHR86_32985 [Streptomyces sp. NBC_00441]|uniref:hypothetical protein n=1 Tax=Streptomyces sp. NBC_00441 TaxID=2975742 RepID=UPI002E281347|nr:hypothetical protein [Streptomyces sp. NBC_00441]